MGVQTISTMEIDLAVFQKVGIQSASRSSCSILGHIPNGTPFYYRTFNQVHCSFIQNSQIPETTCMSLKRRMDKENVTHLHSGVLLSKIAG